jgi:hypothetical protein
MSDGCSPRHAKRLRGSPRSWADEVAGALFWRGVSWDSDHDWRRDFVELPRDGKIDDAKALLMERYFPPDGRTVYYGRQLEVALEPIFHWITRCALNELTAERRINFGAD